MTGCCQSPSETDVCQTLGRRCSSHEWLGEARLATGPKRDYLDIRIGEKIGIGFPKQKKESS